MFVTDEMTVVEAKSLTRMLIKRQCNFFGLNVDQAIHHEATKCGVPVSEVNSLWYRTRKTVSGAVLDNLRNRAEALHEIVRRNELHQRELTRRAAGNLDQEIAKPLLDAVRASERLDTPTI